MRRDAGRSFWHHLRGAGRFGTGSPGVSLASAFAESDGGQANPRLLAGNPVGVGGIGAARSGRSLLLERIKAKFGVDFERIKGFMGGCEHWSNSFNRKPMGATRRPAVAI
jgi:hypothetical protein